MKRKQSSIKTAEFVSPKHPDKICDQMADALLDAYLKKIHSVGQRLKF